jgi:hypothetical protein
MCELQSNDEHALEQMQTRSSSWSSTYKTSIGSGTRMAPPSPAATLGVGL